jgi:peptide-methionine (S)-S-oxide reductase
MGIFRKAAVMPARKNAFPGRSEPLRISGRHFVTDHRIAPPFPAGSRLGLFGLGCFWGAERKFWQTDGVYATAVGYAGGFTPNPTYDEVCTGETGHNEVVRVIFDPKDIDYNDLLRVFWESHDPTQGMRQGNDVGTQYRSGIYAYGAEQLQQAEQSRAEYQAALVNAGLGSITTEIIEAPEFYYAEEYHQQYLAKNPNGYCGIGGCGVAYSAKELAHSQKA